MKKTIIIHALSIILIYIGLQYYLPLLYFGIIIYFTTFDIMGFWYMKAREDKEINKAYRVIQIGTMFILGMMVPDINILILIFLSWWFGICDVLFYIILGQWEMLNFKDMKWLWWTPYGIVNNLFGIKTSGKQLVIYSIIIFILSMGDLWYII